MSNLIELPVCEVCGEEIKGEHCYSGFGFDKAFICVPCMFKAIGSLPDPIGEILDEAADEYWSKTPVKEDGVWI